MLLAGLSASMSICPSNQLFRKTALCPVGPLHDRKSVRGRKTTCRGNIEMILCNYCRVHKTIGRSEVLTQTIFG